MDQVNFAPSGKTGIHRYQSKRPIELCLWGTSRIAAGQNKNSSPEFATAMSLFTIRRKTRCLQIHESFGQEGSSHQGTWCQRSTRLIEHRRLKRTAFVFPRTTWEGRAIFHATSSRWTYDNTNRDNWATTLTWGGRKWSSGGTVGSSRMIMTCLDTLQLFMMTYIRETVLLRDCRLAYNDFGRPFDNQPAVNTVHVQPVPFHTYTRVPGQTMFPGRAGPLPSIHNPNGSFCGCFVQFPPYFVRPGPVTYSH